SVLFRTDTELQLLLQYTAALMATEAHQDAGREAGQSIYPAPTSIREMIKPASAPRCNTATVIGHCYRTSASWFKRNSSIYRLQCSATRSHSSSQSHL
ncbi:mCG141882, isoform CRA_b, partial [Mus musculus]